jgi:hypothetical protein
MNTETKQATKCVASRLPYKDYMSFAEEVAKSGMNMNDYLYKLIMERNDAPKEIIKEKEVIKKVPTIIYKDKIIYKEKKVPQIEYRDREVPKIEYRDREVVKIEYRDREVPKIEYRDREVIKEVPTIKEVIKKVYVDQEVILRDFDALREKLDKRYGINVFDVFQINRDFLRKIRGNTRYTHQELLEFISSRRLEFKTYEINPPDSLFIYSS